MRIVIELKRDAEAEIVLNQLYKHTPMQDSFAMIFLAMVNGQPRELPLPEAIRHFIDHRVEVVRRRTAFLLRKAREREHILLGYQIALDHLDAVIRIIRARPHAPTPARTSSSSSPASVSAARTETRRHQARCREIRASIRQQNADAHLSYRQIDAILELQLHRLTQLSIDELLNELARGARPHRASTKRSSPRRRSCARVIVKSSSRPQGLRRRAPHPDPRRDRRAPTRRPDRRRAGRGHCSATPGYLKRTPISTYRQQRRGGTGRLGMKTREEDFVAQLIVDSTHAYLLCFTNTGRVYWLKVYEIPDVGAAGKGKSMASLLNLQPGESVRTILAVRNLERRGQVHLLRHPQGHGQEDPAQGLLERHGARHHRHRHR